MKRSLVIGGLVLAAGTGAIVASTSGTLSTECACSAGSSCEWNSGLPGAQWERAPRNRTLLPGLWRGSDCRVKTCVEVAGENSMPPECR